MVYLSRNRCGHGKRPVNGQGGKVGENRMNEREARILRKRKTVIVILSLLLAISSAALAIRLVYLHSFAETSPTATVPGNLIGEAPGPSAFPGCPEQALPTESQPIEGAQEEPEAPVISLYKGNPWGNKPFQVANMLPGDSKAAYFAVKVSHHADVAVCFKTQVTGQTKALSQVLLLKATHLETGRLLYSGPLAGMDQNVCRETFSAESPTETVAYYKIEVSLPASVGNEYQAASLTADLIWEVTDADALDPPQTGDDSPVPVYLALAFCALAGMLLLLFLRPGKKEAEDADTK